MTNSNAFSMQSPVPDTHSFRGIIDFGDTNSQRFKGQLNNLAQDNSTHVVSITQFGDSHSAADFFTGELRVLLQAKYGDAGIGWVTPMSVQGQYHTAVSWKSKNWQLFTSRNVNNRDFPMGGYIAEPTKNGGYIQVIPNSLPGVWKTVLTYKPLRRTTDFYLMDANNRRSTVNTTNNKLNHWQTTSATVSAPFSVMADKGGVELGSIWLQKNNQSGVIVSSIATNGARQSIWQKWSANWYTELTASKSDLVILAYGTNESFDAQLKLDEYKQNLIDNIKHVRQALPHAALLIMSSPDTMLAGVKGNTCFERQPPNYHQIRNIQQDIAREYQTLYWDWQTAMGGDCIIEKWMLMDLAKPDLVHLTKAGYMESAKFFYNDLTEYLARQ
ncbi:GDSL-type esterase/lipase family protein [Zophobihabitans entericus]|uniref:Uncharacterized protein n=1 Tax=Zophobihabitans entericus TaxID=1635327 RepID=A0A6G9I9M0_9GAMM|nr:GDSL-type esterase/lipase family protein [Zophobihabitans entericus]QIQ20916.1 hypothetical protein IPMB12_03985 [Zophobihabitans entericus]